MSRRVKLDLSDSALVEDLLTVAREECPDGSLVWKDLTPEQLETYLASRIVEGGMLWEFRYTNPRDLVGRAVMAAIAQLRKKQHTDVEVMIGKTTRSGTVSVVTKRVLNAAAIPSNLPAGKGRNVKGRFTGSHAGEHA